MKKIILIIGILFSSQVSFTDETSAVPKEANTTTVTGRVYIKHYSTKGYSGAVHLANDIAVKICLEYENCLYTKTNEDGDYVFRGVSVGMPYALWIDGQFIGDFLPTPYDMRIPPVYTHRYDY